MQAGASIPIYRWRQMRHGQFFFLGGGGMNKKLLKHVFHYLVYIVFLSFSQKNVLARYARSIAFYSPHLYIFFSFFGVIIPDCQLPKFTKKAHKIAQNCV